MVVEIMQNPERKHLQNKLFNCIYSLFHQKFIKRIQKKYRYNKFQDKLLEIAKDAFEDGIFVFFNKSQKEGFTIRGNLEATLYQYTYFQLLAAFKKDKNEYGADELINESESGSGNGSNEGILPQDLDERENCLMSVVAMLPEKQQDIIIMKFFLDCSSEEIAKNLQVSIGNVYNETSKAYKELNTLFTSHCN